MRGPIVEEITVMTHNPKVKECIVVTITMTTINHPRDTIKGP